MDTRELIIIGTGPSRHDCPYDCETWGVNATYAQREGLEEEGKPFRHDKLFITDYLFSTEGTIHFDLNRIKRLVEKCGTEIYTMHPLRLGRHKLEAKRFPLKRVMAKLGSSYLSSTISYMLSYALYKATEVRDGRLQLKRGSYTHLRLYGIDMSSNLEYRMQKGGVEYWLGYAQGLGMTYTVAEPSAIMQTATGLPYGLKQKVDLDLVDPYNLLGKRKK